MSSMWSGFLPIGDGGGGSGGDISKVAPSCRISAVVDFPDEMVHNSLIGGNPGGVYEDIPSLYEHTENLSSHGSEEEALDNLVRNIPSQDLIPFMNQSYEQSFSLDQFVANPHLTPNHPNPLNTFPSLEEHDQAKLNYRIQLVPATGGKSSWYYSAQLSKVYIKMDQTIYLMAEHLSRNDIETVLRIMMVFHDDVGLPVKRCNNHKATKDSATNNMCHQNESFIESVVRCENSNAEYLGKAEGKNVNDRLSVVIPLSSTAVDEQNMVKQSIALKFVCQNSCIGRRPTAVIFSLEKRNGDVLGKKFISVKICSCPKRDKEKEESKCTSHLKRSADDANLPPVGKKIVKIAKIKEEPKDTPPNTPSSDVQITSEDGIRLELDVPDKEFEKQTLGFMLGQMAMLVRLHPENKTYEKYLKDYEARYIAACITKSENTDG